jgi:hypothetical protein
MTSAWADPNRSALGVERSSASRNAAKFCCFVALLFASSDIWPTLQIGFTFRLSQLLIFLCIPLLIPTFRAHSVKRFPGSIWCLLWVLWTAISLPFSLMISRSIGYSFWLASDLLIIFVFVQAFRDMEDAHNLVKWLLYSFIALSIFGVVQLFAGILGFDILVAQWWVKGVLPRMNGLSYEPSYYSTYMLPGWVLSNYLLSKRVVSIPRGLLRLTATCTSTSLILSTSRLGWALMLLWIALRAGVRFVRFLLGKKAPFNSLRRTILVISLVPIFIGVLASVQTARVTAALEQMSWLINGLGLFGQSSHSSAGRSDLMLLTWNAFLAHPLVGTGLGAVPAEIAAQLGAPMLTIDDAKQNEGMSVAVETLASIGIIGFLIVIGFVSSLVMRYRVVYAKGDAERRHTLRGLSWAIGWLLLALQFNQNFLRIYVWMDIAILTALISIYSKHPAAADRQAGRALASGSAVTGWQLRQ